MLASACACCWLAGCGYIGDPLPPAANIPRKVEDFSAVERGDKICFDFTAPQLTTEGLKIRRPGAFDLRIGGELGDGTLVPVNVDDNGHARGEMAASALAGKSVVAAVRMAGPKGRWSEWSNQVRMDVVTPLAAPAGVRVASDPLGAKLAWAGAQASYRVFRREEKEEKFAELGRSDQPEYVDSTAQFGHSYVYAVLAVRKAGDVEAESVTVETGAFTPRDTFPPAVPAGLTAITSVNTIELAWERNTESDLGGYRVYRALEGGAFEKIGETTAPAYSDRTIESGKKYRYAVSAVDTNKNESERSGPVDATAP